MPLYLRFVRALPLVVVCLLALPSAAFAWQVTVRVHGAGTVTEVTDAELMNCTTPSSVAETTIANCVAGSPSGDYGHGWVVELQASVPAAYFDRGWRFVKWVDGGPGRINCDPQGTTGDHFNTNCAFQIFENLQADLYFDDVAGPQDTSLSSGGPSGTTSSTSATFNFNSGDPDAGYECRLDRPGMPIGGWVTCGSSFDKSESYSALSTNGTYTFNVRGRDPSGNVDAIPASQTWTIDTVGPTTSIGGGPAAGSRTASTSAGFGLSANEAANFQCKLDRPGITGVWTSCGATPGYSSLTDGTHTFSARATDSVGNLGPEASRTWTVDTLPPETSIGSGPSGPTASSSAMFAFSSSEASSTFECKLDSGPWEACSSAKSYTSLAEGGHTFAVRAIDQVGHTDATEATSAWTVDTVTPDTSITSGPSGETTSTTAAFGFSASEAGTSFQCKLDGGAWEGCSSGKTYSALATGPHTFLVRASDAAGNLDQSEAVRSWTVTAPPPGGTQPGGTQPLVTPDTTRPVAVMSFARQRLARVLRKGFVSSVSSTEAGRLRLDVLRRGKVIATSRSRALGAPGAMKLTARLTRKAARTLSRMRSVKLTIRLTATDAAGNVSRKTKRLTLKR